MAKSLKRTSVQNETKELKVDSNSQLKESRKIGTTPFVAHRYDETWICTIGNYRSDRLFSSYEEVVKYVENPDWDLILSTIQAMIDGNKTK